MKLTKIIMAIVLALTAMGGAFANLNGFPEYVIAQAADDEETVNIGGWVEMKEIPSVMYVGNTYTINWWALKGEPEVSFTTTGSFEIIPGMSFSSKETDGRTYGSFSMIAGSTGTVTITVFVYKDKSADLATVSYDQDVTILDRSSTVTETETTEKAVTTTSSTTTKNTTTTTTAVTTKRTATTTTSPAQVSVEKHTINADQDNQYFDVRWYWIRNNCNADIEVESPSDYVELLHFENNSSQGYSSYRIRMTDQSFTEEIWVSVIAPSGKYLQTEIITINYTAPETTTKQTAAATAAATTTTTTSYTTTAAATTSKAVTSAALDPFALYGDANDDGDVNMADAVLIMQSIANPEQYKLTVHGRKNADVFGGGDGVTNNDALAIQQYEADIIKSLPVV